MGWHQALTWRFWCLPQGETLNSDLPPTLRGQRLAILTVRAAHAMCSQVTAATSADTAAGVAPAALAAAADRAATAGAAFVAAAAVRQACPQLAESLDAALAALPRSQRPQWQPSTPLSPDSKPFSPTGGASGGPAFQTTTPMAVPRSPAPMPSGGESYGLPASPFGSGLPGASDHLA